MAAPATYPNLGCALLARYERTGDPADLNRAIEMSAQAVETTPADDIWRPGRSSNLGVDLLAKYEQAGNPADLNRAIKVIAEAVESTPDRPA